MSLFMLDRRSDRQLWRSWLWHDCHNKNVRMRTDVIILIIRVILMVMLTRIRMIKEERLARLGEARPFCSWSAELHSSSWVWEVHWSCLIMYDLLSPEHAREKDIAKHAGRLAVYYVAAAAQVRSGNLLISESDCVLLNTGKNSHFRYESAALFIHFKP